MNIYLRIDLLFCIRFYWPRCTIRSKSLCTWVVLPWPGYCFYTAHCNVSVCNAYHLPEPIWLYQPVCVCVYMRQSDASPKNWRRVLRTKGTHLRVNTYKYSTHHSVFDTPTVKSWTYWVSFSVFWARQDLYSWRLNFRQFFWPSL